MLRFKLPGRFKLIGAMAVVLMVFFSGGAFADELASNAAVTPDIMDKFTNLGLAMLVAHMWSKDSESKNNFIKNLFEEQKEEKAKLLEFIKDLNKG